MCLILKKPPARSKPSDGVGPNVSICTYNGISRPSVRISVSHIFSAGDEMYRIAGSVIGSGRLANSSPEPNVAGGGGTDRRNSPVSGFAKFVRTHACCVTLVDEQSPVTETKIGISLSVLRIVTSTSQNCGKFGLVMRRGSHPSSYVGASKYVVNIVSVSSASY